MAGGGTGGHVLPAIAVARELQRRGHRAVFIGTRAGFEARLAPAAGFPLKYIEIGGLNRVGWAQALRTLAQLPGSARGALRWIDEYRPSALFSMGGYAAGPVALAALWRRLPVVLMEPNAVPGLTNRQIGRFAARALLSFPETARFFPRVKTEITGLPVRPEFFALPEKARGDGLAVLITGGSRGSRTLNNAARASWPYFREAAFRVRLTHQTGVEAHSAIAAEFQGSGLAGEAAPFIDDMPGAFAKADLIVCRSGAGAVAELAAAGKPAILVPFPFAADDHQLRNAEAFANAGAARMVLDREMNGRRLFEEVEKLASGPAALDEMAARARVFAHPDAARRAADVLEEVSEGSGA